MAVSLKKGQRVDLRKNDGETLKNVTVGLGWDVIVPPKKGGFLGIFASQPAPPDIDCDASVLLCKEGKVKDNSDVVYYRNRKHKSGAIYHMGDNLTGAGDGDDEQINVKLMDIPAEYDKLVFVVNIFKAQERNQHFGMIQNCFIRIIDNDTRVELCRFDLSENYSGQTAMIFGEVYRKDGGWKFNAIGQGTTDDSLMQLVQRFS